MAEGQEIGEISLQKEVHLPPDHSSKKDTLAWLQRAEEEKKPVEPMLALQQILAAEITDVKEKEAQNKTKAGEEKLAKFRALEASAMTLMFGEAVADVSSLSEYCENEMNQWVQKANVKPTQENIDNRDLFEKLELAVNGYGPQNDAEFPDAQPELIATTT